MRSMLLAEGFAWQRRPAKLTGGKRRGCLFASHYQLTERAG
jgi:hypothetical protein